jgi:hypothetical protein
MANVIGQHEISDNEGSTVIFSGTATTTPANVPSVAGNVISGAGISNTGSVNLRVSFDGGSTFTTVEKKTFLSWNIKGQVTQIVVETLTGSTTYEIIANLEEN